MGPIKAVRTATAKLFNFRGRASRSEFWWVTLFAVIAGGIIAMIFTSVFGVSPEEKILPDGLMTIVLALPFMALITRRLNDVGCGLWQHIVYWLYIPLSIITKFMISGALPKWAGMTYAITVLVWAAVWLFVYIQFFRKGHGGDESDYEYEDDDESQDFTPQLYVPPAQPVNAYGRY